MPLPNAVIIGAPKCGTSSVFQWLIDHPDVCASDRKETFYLMDSDNPIGRGRTFADGGVAGYEEIFEKCTLPIVVDATSHYLYQSVAREVLASLETDPAVFVLLRKPSDRVYSSFQYTKYNRAGIDPDLSFAGYVEAILSSRFDDIEKHVHSPLSFYVLQREVQYSQYADYLIPWRDRLPSRRLHVRLLEDIRRDPLALMDDMCRILSIAPEYYSKYDFAVENRTFQVRGLRLHRLALAMSRYLPLGRMKEGLKHIYYGAQASARAERTEEDCRALARLDAHFISHNDRLQRELELDLSAWAD